MEHSETGPSPKNWNVHSKVASSVQSLYFIPLFANVKYQTINNV
jgi:hypothetical protein